MSGTGVYVPSPIKRSRRTSAEMDTGQVARQYLTPISHVCDYAIGAPDDCEALAALIIFAEGTRRLLSVLPIIEGVVQ